MSTGSAIISPMTPNGAIPTEYSDNFGAVSAYKDQKVASERKLASYKYSDSILQINFIETFLGIGSFATTSVGFIDLSTGAQINSGLTFQTKRRISQPVGRGIMLRCPVVFTTAGVSGNIRAFGLFDDTDGFCIRLNGTALEFVTSKGGVDTVIDSSTWDIPVTPDTNTHLWEIQTKSASSGDYDIFMDKVLVHRIRSVGVTSTSFSDKNDLPFRISNNNDGTNASDELMQVCPTLIFEEGASSTIVSDGQKDISINAARRLNVQAGFTYLMSQDMDIPLNFTTQWALTETGGATFTQPTNTFTANYNTTVANGDIVQILYSQNNLRQGVGEFAVFEAGISFGTNNPTGNVKEWGYLDSALLNGVFFRLNGGDFEFVTVKGGVETVTSLSQAKPNANFHNFRIEQLGAGKIIGSIINEAGQIVDFSPAAISLVGSGEKKPFIKMYNTIALASVPDPMENHWVRLLDNSGSSTEIVGKDENNTPRPVATTSTGRLLVSQEPPTPPPDTFTIDPTDRIADGSMSGTQDLLYTITNLRTLTVQRLQGGAGTSNSGTVVELFKDLNGDLSVLELITKLFVNGVSAQADLNPDTIVGDGTARILLRRRQLGGGASEVFGRWDGYESDTI